MRGGAGRRAASRAESGGLGTRGQEAWGGRGAARPPRDARTAAGARPAPSPGGRGDNARPAGQSRPCAPARRTRAAPPRSKGSGGKAPGAMAGPARRALSPAHLRAHFTRPVPGRPTSSSRVPPEPEPVPVPVPVLCSSSGFRLLMVRGGGRGDERKGTRRARAAPAPARRWEGAR